MALRLHAEAPLPGIWKLTFGTPELHTPLTILPVEPTMEALEKLGAPEKCPLDPEEIAFRPTSRGSLLELPMTATEEIYGFGLQLKSHRQTGKKKLLRVNSDPVADTGDSHAPVPFYVSTAGYGVLVDSARYLSFYSGSHQRVEDIPDDLPAGLSEIETSTEELYGAKKQAATRRMAIEVPHTAGVDIYIFAGPTLLDAVRRYVLFCGGGALPPLWGLGIWYRVYGKFNQADTLKLAKSFRKANLPCDVLGLEPGWQSNAYSCTYLWNQKNFPEPDQLVGDLTRLGYKINLWEHAFVHPGAPIHRELKPLSGDLAVWKGLVPDFTLEKTREIFARHHEEAFVKKGISGFKLDECDHSDFIGSPWSFPEHTRFPSGVDGEQMHSLFGLLYQKTILEPFVRQNVRTYSEVRSSYAPAAHLPFVLYSDLYAHRDFMRGLVNAGFAGLLWSPEVRQCVSVEDLIRRLQTVALSPQALVNSWMIPNPPWWQFEEEKNRGNVSLRGWKKVEAMVREIFELRMSLLPYLYSAFARYHDDGTPPFRALVMDHPHDPEVLDIDDQFLVGDSLLAAPMVAGEKKRRVYLPAGTWYDFFSPRKYEGEKWHEVEPELRHIPLFVKDNVLLPLAKPLLHVAADTTFEMTVRVYGATPTPFDLYVDDGVSFDYEKGKRGWLKLSWSGDTGTAEPSGETDRQLYKIVAWTRIFDR